MNFGASRLIISYSQVIHILTSIEKCYVSIHEIPRIISSVCSTDGFFGDQSDISICEDI